VSSQELQMELWKRNLWGEIQRRVESGDIIVLSVSERTSEGFYNYKTRVLYVIYSKNINASYEESFERNISVIDISVGAFQPFTWNNVNREIRKLRRKGFSVRHITV
jgi:hypothetical protein